MTEHPTPEAMPDGDTAATGAIAEGEAREIFNADVPHATTERPLSDAARRALLEAAERRAAEATAEDSAGAAEHGGRNGPEPTRYGDWEKKGLAIDF